MVRDSACSIRDGRRPSGPSYRNSGSHTDPVKCRVRLSQTVHVESMREGESCPLLRDSFVAYMGTVWYDLQRRRGLRL